MKLLVFGMGYSARFVREELRPSGAAVRGTTRDASKFEMLRALDVTPRLFPGSDLSDDLAWASHCLITAGPKDGRDPVLEALSPTFIREAARLTWVGYLSTTGVYGDHGGAWVTEETPVAPSTERGKARARAEAAWQELHRDHDLPLHIFRLPGIYGPGRGPFAKLRAGTARRIVKPDQVFGRIHVEDIAQTVAASMRAPDPGAIYNVADDDPAPPQDVISYAASLLDMAPPPEIPFDEAEMTPMARSFYAESKRIANRRIKDELGIRLRYPTYREGLRAVLAAETGE
jgi:nucleoside-diphosphate-sugar epimerase